MAAEEIARRRLMWQKIMRGAKQVEDGLMQMLRAVMDYHTGGDLSLPDNNILPAGSSPRA